MEGKAQTALETAGRRNCRTEEKLYSTKRKRSEGHRKDSVGGGQETKNMNKGRERGKETTN